VAWGAAWPIRNHQPQCVSVRFEAIGTWRRVRQFKTGTSVGAPPRPSQSLWACHPINITPIAEPLGVPPVPLYFSLRLRVFAIGSSFGETITSAKAVRLIGTAANAGRLMGGGLGVFGSGDLDAIDSRFKTQKRFDQIQRLGGNR
jgi:hypothetical protein